MTLPTERGLPAKNEFLNTRPLAWIPTEGN
jgi:hypothetical protein